MTSTPTLVVEVSFTIDPFAAPTWTDISAYVRDGEVKRGRSTELDEFATGACRITLDNRDRRFDPTNTSGPYYGYILPRNPVRVRALWSGTYYPIFQGYVAAWPQDRDLSNRDATATINAVDGLGILAARRLQADYYASYLDTLNPQNEWPLGGEGQTQVDIVNQQNFTLTADLAHGEAACATYLSGNPTTFDTLNFGMNGGVTTTGNFSVIAFFRTNLTGPRGILEGSDGSATVNRLYVDAFGLPHYDAGGAGVYGNQFVNDGANHMIVLTHASSTATAPTMYVDGLDKSAGGAGAATSPMVWRILAAQGLGTGHSPFVGPLQQVAIVPSILTPTQVANLYYAAESAYVGRRSDEQVAAVLDAAGWPTTLGGASYRDISTASYFSQDYIDTGNSTALDVIQKITASEQGQFYVSASGKATFLGAWDLYAKTRSATAQYVLADDSTAGSVPYLDTGFDLDDAQLSNEVEVKTSSGQSVITRNAISIAIYGRRTASIQTRLRTIGEAQTLANARIARYAMPMPRLRTITILPQADPANAFPKVLATELQDRVTIKARPLGTGSTYLQDYWVEGISHTFGANEWRVQMNASQVPSGGYWDLGTDALDGVSTRLN